MEYTGNETRDGGQTPGPFEEMRRRMAGLATSTPISPAAPGGVRKRRKKEKRRRWVWTIGQEEEEEEGPTPGSSAKTVVSASKPVAVPVISMPAPRRASTRQSPRKTVAGPLILTAPAEFVPVTAVPFDIEPPTPSVESSEGHDSLFEETADVEMSDASSVITADMEVDSITPTNPKRERSASARLSSAEPGIVNRDTPIPPDLLPPTE
jgi:hypothetical protein